MHRITDRGDVRVQFNSETRWTFHPGALTKVGAGNAAGKWLNLLGQGSECPQQVLQEHPAPLNTIILFYELLHLQVLKVNSISSFQLPGPHPSAAALPL